MNWANTLSVIFILHFQMIGHIFTEEVVKCLTKQNDQIRISCPNNHVLYNPSILAGESKASTCQPKPEDCVGISETLQRRVEKCYWRKSCKIILCKADKLSCNGLKGNSSNHTVDYVIIKHIYCIPKDMTIDICSNKKHPDFTKGVIRSHRMYSRKRRTTRNVCNITIPIRDSQTLFAELITSNNQVPSNLKFQYLNKTNSSTIGRTYNKRIVLHGNTTSALRVIADFTCKKKHTQGFMLPFAVYGSKMLDGFLEWANDSRPMMREMGWIFEVKPVIEQCAANSGGEVTLVCNDNEVIYSPEISMAGYTTEQGKCLFGRYPCGGLTPDMLIQRNACYWNNTCQLKWTGSQRIILSKEAKCVGYSTAVVGLSGHRCVPKERVFDLCNDDNSGVMDTSWAIIRSHSSYPWYFGAFKQCKRIIKVGARKSLLFAIQDMNLDPDGNDKFSITHITKSYQTVVMDTKTAKEGKQIRVNGGKLVVKFKPYAESKTGRGFIIVLHRFHVSKHELPDLANYKVEQMHHTSGIVSDADATMPERLSIRRQCSLRDRLWRKNNACNRLVWTDYFTRLE